MKVLYDKSADAAYIQLVKKIKKGGVASTSPIDPEVGLINLDFDKEGKLLGIEVLSASKILPEQTLKGAEILKDQEIFLDLNWAEEEVEQKIAAQQINNYFSDLPDDIKQLCLKIHKIIMSSDPKMKEDWKWDKPAYSTSKLKFGITGSKTGAKLTFYQGGQMSDPMNLFDLNSKKIRNIHYSSTEKLDENALTQYIKAAIGITDKS